MAKVIRQDKNDEGLRYPVTEEVTIKEAQKTADRLNEAFGDRAIYTVEA